MHKSKLLNFLRGSLAVLLLGSTASAVAADTTNVVVVQQDGSTYEVPMPTMDKIEFAGDGFMISHEGISKWFDYSQVDRILFGAEANAVSEAVAKGDIAVWPSPATDIVNITGLTEGTTVDIYTNSGVRIASATASEGTLRLDISASPVGTLILKAGDISVKILKN